MELLTVRETADRLKVAQITVRRYIAQGRLPALKVGKGVRIRAEALDQVIEPIVPKRVRPRRRVLKGKPLTYDDPMWKLVGFATDAEPTDASRIHEYIADSILPQSP